MYILYIIQYTAKKDFFYFSISKIHYTHNYNYTLAGGTREERGGAQGSKLNLITTIW